jgi:hypothetical protein
VVQLMLLPLLAVGACNAPSQWNQWESLNAVFDEPSPATAWNLNFSTASHSVRKKTVN